MPIIHRKPRNVEITFRENWDTNCVVCIVNDIRMFERPDYSTTAKIAIAQYRLTDGEMRMIYEDYKEDYDS